MPIAVIPAVEVERRAWSAPTVESFDTAPEMSFYCGRA